MTKVEKLNKLINIEEAKIDNTNKLLNEASSRQDDPELWSLFDAIEKEGNVQSALEYGININKIKNNNIKKVLIDVQKAITNFKKVADKVRKDIKWKY